MYLKLVRCFCFVICFVGVRSQRGWAPNGYNAGFSNSWAPNGFSNQNVGNWGFNEPRQPVFGSSQFNSPFEKNRRPVEEQSSFGSSDKKTGWSSSAGISESGFDTRKPDKKKFASIINGPNAGTNSASENDNFSSWGQASGSNNQNSNGWNSNSGKNSNADSNDSNSFSSYDSSFSSFGSNRPSGTNGQNAEPTDQMNNNVNKRPNSFSSGSNNEFSNWGSSFQNSKDFNNKPTGNDAALGSDYEENSVYSYNSNRGKNKPNKNKWETTTSKPSKSTSKPSGSGNWNQNGNGKAQEGSNTQNNTKPTPDTSILDELDKNDWYFGKESNYPKPPFKSVLNIDVSELWNFDRNRKSNQNSRDRKNKSSNNSRRNRQTGGEGGTHCECVSVNLCDEEDMIVAQEDLKLGWGPLEAFRCERLTEVCCTNPKLRFSARSNVEDENEGTLSCGQRRIRGSPFTGALGGNVADPGEFPWDLQLQTSENNCSASLIHPQLALTAAHCVTNVPPHEVNLKAGVWGSNKEPPQHRKVSRIIPHPAYSSQNPRNDIALLVVGNGFELNDNVNTICLPFSNDKWNSDRCLVAGWRPEEVNDEIVRVVEKGAVDFIAQPECQNIMLVTDLWRDYVLHDSFICAREKAGNGACLWNEGGAVVCPSQNRPDAYLQIGIVSKGMNCDNFGRPGIFTNVLKFLDWINQNHFDLGLNYDLDIRSQ